MESNLDKLIGETIKSVELKEYSDADGYRAFQVHTVKTDSGKEFYLVSDAGDLSDYYATAFLTDNEEHYKEIVKDKKKLL